MKSLSTFLIITCLYLIVLWYFKPAPANATAEKHYSHVEAYGYRETTEEVFIVPREMLNDCTTVYYNEQTWDRDFMDKDCGKILIVDGKMLGIDENMTK